MNRTDRLYALVEELRARAPRPMRASELADRFEVTTRTIERDLLALQESGVPIWAQPGPGGGYSLDVDTTLPPLNLTPAEAAAIATALAATRAMPFAEAGITALKKVSGVMASAPKSSASKLVSHIRVVPGPQTGPAGHPDFLTFVEPRFRKAVQRAYGLAHEPTDAELERISEPWRPYRMWITFLLRQHAEDG